MRSTPSRFLEAPHSRSGKWAVGLGLTFVVMFLVNAFVFMPATLEIPWRQVLLPFYGISMILCGLASGGLSALTLMRQHEHSWMLWLGILPGLLILFLLVGELLFPH